MAPKTPTKKRTRRAVNARRSLAEREQAANKHLDEWLTKMRFAMNKVEHYRRELKKVHKVHAKKVHKVHAKEAADAVFGVDDT